MIFVGRDVIFETIGGRTTAIVPSLQRKQGKAPAEPQVDTDQVDRDEVNSEGLPDTWIPSFFCALRRMSDATE